MKKILFLCFSAFILVSISASASSSNGQDKEPLDSLAYIFPEFIEGTVVFNDKTFSHGVLNICIVDQSIKTINKEGEMLDAVGSEGVTCVLAAGRKFYKDRGIFVELIKTDGDFGFGIAKSTTVVNNVKRGAFGTEDHTSSISSYSRDPYTKSLQEFVLDNPDNYVHKVEPYLFKNGAPVVFNKKNLQKCFPQQKAFIEEYIASHEAAVGDISQARELYEQLIEKTK